MMNKEDNVIAGKSFTYVQEPMAIENGSFEIIHQELQMIYGQVDFTTKTHEAIIKRVIHTSADFDYYKNLVFSSGVVERLSASLTGAAGLTIYTDTNMIIAGINKRVLSRLGIQITCLVAEEEVFAAAKAQGITRSMAAVDIALKRPGKKLFVFGNAPTALFRVLEQDYEGQFMADLVGVIGVPVGFVGAEESKAALAASNLPHIAALGRKGGSNVAAAIINALLYTLTENRE